MPTILHTADFHIGAPFAGLPDDIAARLREEAFTVLETLCREAQERDAMLICGDLFDNPAPSGAAARRVAEILETARVPVFISAGNHDYIHAASPYRLTRFPHNVCIFSAETMERVELDGFVVYGRSMTSDFARPLFNGFRANDAKPSVMCLHGEVEPIEPVYCPISKSDIAQSGLSYLALGHIHTRTEPQRVGGTVFAQCGAPRHRSFRNPGPCGAYAVELDRQVEFIDSRSRPFCAVRLDVSAADDIDALLNRETAKLERGAVARITLCGECQPERLRLSSRTAAGDALYVEYVDDTRLPRNIKANTESLAGLVLLEAARMAEKGANERDLDLAVRYALSAIYGENTPEVSHDYT